MREAQTEIKAIEAQLRSIRADSRPGQGVAPKGVKPYPTDSHRSPTSNQSASTPRTATPRYNPPLGQAHAAAPARPAPSLPTLPHTPAQSTGHDPLQEYASSGQVRQQQAPPRQIPPRQAPQRSVPQSQAPQSQTSQRQVPQKQAPQRQAPQKQAPQSYRVQSYPLPIPPAYSSGFQQELAATLEQLEQQSARYIHQFKQFQSLSPQHSKQALNQSLQVLDTQAQYINQLSGIQETAIQELKTIAEQIEHDWKVSEQASVSYAAVPENDRHSPQVFECQNTAVPQVAKDQRGVYLLSSRSIDLYKAEREAALTAQALRLWSKRGRSAQAPQAKPGFWAWLANALMITEPEQASSQTAQPQPSAAPPSAAQPSATQPSATQPSATRSPVTQSQPLRQPQPPRQSQRHSSAAPPPQTAKRAVRYQRSQRRRSLLAPGFGIREAASFVFGAIAVRVLLNLLLSAYPVLWTPTIALLATPAAIAVYRSSRTPRSGLVWGYRLLLIMIGLLLGGRL
ncbi:MAG: hypothetical protein Kow00121_17030 [Elainellaceae cyanobacterium]